MDFDFVSIYRIFLGCFSQIIAVYAIFHQWFRFPVKISMTVVTALGLVELWAMNYVTEANGWILGLASSLNLLGLVPLMRNGARRLMLILFMIYVFVYNIFGTAIISVLTTVYGLFTGKSNQTWFVAETMTQADVILKTMGIFLGYLAAILICRKCILLLDYLNEREKWIFSLGYAIADVLYLMGSRTFITSAEEQLGGIWVVLYALYSVWLAALTFLSLALPMIRLRRENRKLQIQMQEQYEYYQKVLETQFQLREIRHDLKNRLVAETVAKETKEL